MMNFVCIKWGTKYTAEHVNNLYKMVQKNYTRDFTFTCYTEEPEGLICDSAYIPDDGILHPKYWSTRKTIAGIERSFSYLIHTSGYTILANGVTWI